MAQLELGDIVEIRRGHHFIATGEPVEEGDRIGRVFGIDWHDGTARMRLVRSARIADVPISDLTVIAPDAHY